MEASYYAAGMTARGCEHSDELQAGGDFLVTVCGGQPLLLELRERLLEFHELFLAELGNSAVLAF